MNLTTPMNNEFESTYALLIRSEEKGRGLLETLAYTLLILSGVFSIWQFAHQSVILPTDKIAGARHEAIEAQRG